MTTPPMLSSTFLAHYQQCVKPWKQQWLSWQLPDALPAALRNELVSQIHLEVQSERGNQQSPSNKVSHISSSRSSSRIRKYASGPFLSFCYLLSLVYHRRNMIQKWRFGFFVYHQRFFWSDHQSIMGVSLIQFLDPLPMLYHWYSRWSLCITSVGTDKITVNTQAQHY